MRCPSCGYVRKADDMAPEWQCPACQVVYEKVSRTFAEPLRPSRTSLPSGVSKPSSGAPNIFKMGFTVALLGCLIYFGYSFFSGNAGAKGSSIVTSVESSLRSDQDTRELINCKKAELKAYEDGLQKVEADIASMKANVGTCPITGQPNQFILKEDPRPELQAKIEKLKEEIRQLESKS